MIRHFTKTDLWPKLETFLGILVVASVLTVIFVLSHTHIYDLDIWLHLKTGEYIASHKAVPALDIFSSTMQGKPWIDHSWLFQLLSYLVYSRWQADGLILLQSTVITLAFLFLFFIGLKKTKSYLEAAIFIFFTAYVCIGRFNIRPEIFSLLFFSVYLYLLFYYSSTRWIWLLLPLEVLWVNFHGYFFLGPLLVLVFITAQSGGGGRGRIKFLSVPAQEQGAPDTAANPRLKKLFLPLTLSTLINPNGLRGALYPFFIFKEALTGRMHIFLKYIQELRPTFQAANELSNSYHYYLAMILVSSALIAFNLKKIKPVEIALWVFFFFFSLTVRNIAFFAFISYAVMISYIVSAITKVSKRIEVNRGRSRRPYFLAKYILSVAVIICMFLFIHQALGQKYYDFENNEFKSSIKGIDLNSFPRRAADFIVSRGISGNIFNDFNSGSYLIGRAYPQIKVFIDGRTELYGPEFFKEYLTIIEGDSAVFERVVDEFKLRAALFEINTQSPAEIISYLYKSPGWSLVFFDAAGIIFLKDTPENKGLIIRNKLDLSRYSVAPFNLIPLGLESVVPWANIKRAFLFNLLEEDKLAIAECEEALRIMPDCFQAEQILGKVYLRQGLYRQAFLKLRRASILSPGDKEILVELGTCLMKLKENFRAGEVFKRAIKLDAGYAPAYYGLGAAYLAVNRVRPAAEVLAKAVALNPRQALYRFKLGEAFKRSAEIGKAREELEAALNLSICRQEEELTREIKAGLKEIGKRR